jgi:endonuclease/exonuclease/phosphatase family metal-dependent hydrolase
VPLDVVSRHLDPRGDHLEVVDALQLDGRSNATWSDPGKPFAPGRLDYMLYSDSTLEVARAFVFDSADLGAEWLDRHGVQAGDSAAASDHLPIVADFRWKRR